MKDQTTELFDETSTEVIVESESNHLLEIVKNSGLNEEKSLVLINKFEEFTKTVDEWKEKSKALVITDITQKTEMKMCREAYLLIKGKVVDIEKTRKALKEDSLKEGRAIDEVAKELKNLLEPLRDELKEKSEFAERAEAARKEELKAERLKALEPFGTDTTFIPLGDLSDEDWATLFEKEQSFFNFQKEKAEKEEAERIEREKQEELARIEAEKKRIEEERLRKEEEERIRAENERLKKEAEEKERALEQERAKVEAERKAAEVKAEQERVKREAEAEKLRKQQEEMIRKQEEENAKKLQAEREAREKVEAELKAKQEAERKAEEERKVADMKAKKEAEKLAKAPVKSQLKNWVVGFEIAPMPIEHDTAKLIREKFEAFTNWAMEQVNNI